MSWLLAFLLAVAAFVVTAFVLKAPRKGWEAIGAALLFGIAGYGLQGSPGLAGSPKDAAQKVSNPREGIAAAQKALGSDATPGMGGNSWIVIADALARHGQYADAASVLLGAVEKQPDDVEAWYKLANALVDHSDGTLSPASLYAYRRAVAANPDHPAPPFFLGLAMARSGRLGEARGLWAELLGRSPPDAPWRPDLEARLRDLDAFIARQQTTAPQP